MGCVGDAISADIATPATRRRKHGHFQRDLQLVGRQHLVQPHLHGGSGASWSAPTTRATATTSRARASARWACRAAGSSTGIWRRPRRYRPSGTAGCTTWSTRRRPRKTTRRGPGRRAPHEHDGHAPGLPAARQHSGQRQAAQGDGRLQALAADRAEAAEASRWRHRSRRHVLAPRFSPHRGTCERTGDRGSHAADACMSRLGKARLPAAGCARVLSGRARPHAQRVDNAIAVFAALDKVTAARQAAQRAAQPDRRFRTLKITPRACYTRAPTEPPQDLHLRGGRRGHVRRQGEAHLHRLDVCREPRLNAVEHPVFDVWLTDCSFRATAPRPPPQAGAPAAPGGPAPPPDPDPFEPRRRRVPR